MSEAHRLANALETRNTSRTSFVLGPVYEAAAAELRRLQAENEALRANAERYRVLRCYELGGSWPDGFKAPSGLIAFGRGLTQNELDKTLDDMLGYLPHPFAENVRPDYQQWQREQTLNRVAAIEAANKDEA